MLRKPTSEKNPADWFAFASERIHGADVLYKHEGVTGTGVEALQEGLERYLKGYLIARGWQLVKTHDLTLLNKEAKKFESAFAAFEAMTEELTEDFFAQHYPGEDTTSVGQNYATLREQASQMIALIEQSLPQYFPKPPTK